MTAGIRIDATGVVEVPDEELDNERLIEEAAATGADEVCTACPFCLTMLGDAIKETDRSDSLRARDIAEVMLENLA